MRCLFLKRNRMRKYRIQFNFRRLWRIFIASMLVSGFVWCLTWDKCGQPIELIMGIANLYCSFGCLVMCAAMYIIFVRLLYRIIGLETTEKEKHKNEER